MVMNTAQKSKILEALGNKTNKVFFIVDRHDMHFEVYNVNDVLIAKFSRDEMDELIFNAKIAVIEKDHSKAKDEKALEELRAKTKGAKPVYNLS